MKHYLLITLLTVSSLIPTASANDTALTQARESSEIAGYSLSKVQRWLHEVALPKIDPETNLYISHTNGSGRYREALWNYDDAAADTYPFLFWAAYYTNYDQINGPVLDVLIAEQKYGNYLDRIPTAVNHETLEQVIKDKDTTIFAASEYVKDGLIAIIEVAGKDNPWFDRMRGIEDDIWKHADIDTPFGKIPTENIEANGEQIQALVRLYTMTGEEKYLTWAERLADYFLSDENFVPQRLRDHGSEIIGGLGLLLGVESEHNPEKAQEYLVRLKPMLDEILANGTNEDGMMYNSLNQGGGQLSDSWGYNYVAYLCYDQVAGKPVYQAHLEQTLRNLAKPVYTHYNWEGNHSIDGYADSIEGAIYLLNRLPIPEGLAWIDQEMANNVTRASDPLDTAKLWTAYKLESNGVRTVLQHAMMHTRGTIARPWQQNLKLGASESEDGLTVVIKSKDAYQGKLIFDLPRHRTEMGFTYDWPRMNTMPEWFTVESDRHYTVQNLTTGNTNTYSGKQLSDGLSIKLEAGEEQVLIIKQSPYSDGRPAPTMRMDAKDHGIVLRYGDGPDQCDILGARDVWVFENNGTYYMHYDAAGAKGWLSSLATSKDLLTWEKKGPILDFGKPDEDDSAGACYGVTYKDGDQWHMFYLGTPNVSSAPNLIPSFPYLTMKAKANSPAGPWIKQKNVTPFRTKPDTYYSLTASPGQVIKSGDEYLQFFSSTTRKPGNPSVQRTLGIARTKDLDSAWTVDPEPMVPIEEQIENSTFYYEKTINTWFLFTNHIGINNDGGEFTDAIWVYWTQDLNTWNPANKAIVLDGQNCTWSKKCIGLPSVVQVKNRLALFYDAPSDNSTSHMKRHVGLAWLDLPLSVPSPQPHH